MPAPSPMMVPLGFASEIVPAGTHICQIFSDDDERDRSLQEFILSGLRNGERTACFSENAAADDIRAFFEGKGLSYDALSRKGAFSLEGTREIYFQGDRFDPDRMLGLLAAFHRDAIAAGYPAARVIGEMTPDVQALPGGEQLLTYESKVSLMLREVPITSVCQYDARAFDGAMIMDILKVHPHMVVRGVVVHNPFYIPPEEFLQQ